MATSPEKIDEKLDDVRANLEARKRSSEKVKEQANMHFKKASYTTAIGLYGYAIDVFPTAILFANRSLAHLKEESFGQALIDANSAINLDKNYVKAYYRRGSANFALGKLKAALADFEAVCAATPNDPDARARRDECRKLCKLRAFQRAIHVEQTKRNLTEMVNVDSIEVEESYKGPRLDGSVTAEFMEELMKFYKGQGILHAKYAYKMLLEFYALVQTLPTMVEIEEDEITVCGDIHGQFYDLCNLFEIRGLPSEYNPYLFNGDFVDRGSFSVECIFTLMGFKLLYPNHFFMVRGNHESDLMNHMYGFEGEVKAKYSEKMWPFFQTIFEWLPLCHLINKEVFVCHGGLFKEDGVTLDDIRAVERVSQPPDQGIMTDLLWADPMDQDGRKPSKRGTSIMFGPDVTEKFCRQNRLRYVIRSHEVMPKGYAVQPGNKCFTIFSAPNYCDQSGNEGAYAIVRRGNSAPDIHQFQAVPHPDVPAMTYGRTQLFGF